MGLTNRTVDENETDFTHPRIKKSSRKFAKEKRVLAWSSHRTSWYMRRGACSAVCRNIREALPDAYCEQLKNELMGYKEVSIKDYFDHLDKHGAKWIPKQSMGHK